jgi:putative ABC transport system permease protein
MDALVQDVRFALRTFARQPAFTLVAIATLALGIGANTAIFTVVNAVVLEPLPFAAGERLVRVTADLPGLGTSDIGLSIPELLDYRDRSGLFDEIAGVYPIDANLTEVDLPERIELLLVSPSYFSVLGAHPQLGRVFGAEDNHPGIAEVVVISDALWKRRFAGAPDVLGRKLRIDADLYTIVGVMPPDFRHPGRSLRTDVEMWAPSGYSAAPFRAPNRAAYFLSGGIGRLKAGISPEEAQQRLDAFARRLREEYPVAYPARAAWTPRIITLQQDVVGSVRTPLLMMLGAVAIVLLIACANIAGLLLARAAARQRELAVRRAMGSGRARLARLLLTESLLLSLCGGAAGLLLAVWGVDLLVSLVPAGLPRMWEVAISGRVLAFTFGAAIATGILFGLAPAVQFSNPDVLTALKDGRSPAAESRRTLRSALVIAEFALAMVLLVGAALLVRSFWRLQNVDAGFDGRNVLTARVWLPQPNDPAAGKYFTHPARLALFDEILRRVRALPGVESAAVVQNLPLDGQSGSRTFTIDGRDADTTGQIPAVQANLASADYFELMRIPVLRGRTFGPIDDAKGAPVAVINQEFVRLHFGGVEPIGARLHFGGAAATAPWMTIVGVVGNVLSQRLEEAPRPMLFQPLTQNSTLSMAIVARTGSDPARLSDALSRAVREADPDQPTYAVRTMEEVQAAATATRRFLMQLLGGFAILALLLAAIGIYGVMAYLVSQRTREIGIRMALGARPWTVVRLVVTYALGMAGAGVVLGMGAAVILTRLITGMLFEVSPTDPSTFAAIAVTLVGTAILAAMTPARRAARIDPMVALRGD